MSRILMLVLAVLVFFWLVRRALSSRSGPDAPAGRRAPAAIPDLVECARCGVLVPKDEALGVGVAAGAGAGAGTGAAPAQTVRYFCSEEHRRQGAR